MNWKLTPEQQEIVVRFQKMLVMEVDLQMKRLPSSYDRGDIEAAAVDAMFRVARWYDPNRGIPLAPLMAKFMRLSMQKKAKSLVTKGKNQRASFGRCLTINIDQLYTRSNEVIPHDAVERHDSFIHAIGWIRAEFAATPDVVDIFVDSVYLGHSYAEIAQHRNLTIDVVRQSISRVRKKLRSCHARSKHSKLEANERQPLRQGALVSPLQGEEGGCGHDSGLRLGPRHSARPGQTPGERRSDASQGKTTRPDQHSEIADGCLGEIQITGGRQRYLF